MHLKALLPHSIILFFLCTTLTACGNDDASSSAKTATLRIGEGIQFATGKISKLESEGDMVFRYQPPQSPHGWRYNPVTGMIEYQAQVGTNQNYPLLSASKSAAFKTNPDIKKMTAGDVNQWSENEFDIGPGRFILVRGYTDKKHWLVKILQLTASSNDPKTWQLRFSYEPISLANGAPGTVETNFDLSGSLTFRERLNSEKIVTLNLANATLTELFDGYGVSRNQRGEFAYVDAALRIVIADKSGKSIGNFNPPASASTENTVSGSGNMETSISPSGNFIAVGGISRRANYQEGGINIQGIPSFSIAVVDRSGKEVAAFYAGSYPTWTASGKLLMANLDNPGIFITDASLGNLRAIPNVPAGSIQGISVSPDEKIIAFSLNNRIWLINMDGSGLRQLDQDGLNEVTPNWSPDGKYLAFQQSFKNKKEFFQIIVQRMSDGKRMSVTDKEGANREPSGVMNWISLE